MSGIFTIAWKELKDYFNSVIGYAILTLLLFITGGFFWALLQSYAQMSEQSAGNPMMGDLPPLTEVVIGYLFSNMSIILVLAAPLLTMRLMAEEQRNRTLELLMTAPVSSLEIVLGKFFGSMGFMTIALLLTLHYPILLFQVGNPDIGPILTSYLGALLLSGVLVSLGLLASSLTQHQLVAGVISFGSGLTLMVILGWLVGENGGPIWKFLTLTEHYDSFTKGLIKLESVTYFVSLIVFFLFATLQRIETMRRQ